MILEALLKSRNRCLDRFLIITKTFLNKIESTQDTNLPDLDLFMAEREAVIKALGLFDRKITETAQELSVLEDKNSLKNFAQSIIEPLLEERVCIIQNIIQTDEKLFKIINQEKVKIACELGSTRKLKDNMSKFKSIWVTEAGEGIDTKL